MTPSTKLPRYFCAGIGPLQLGVVLVIIFFIDNFYISEGEKIVMLLAMLTHDKNFLLIPKDYALIAHTS